MILTIDIGNTNIAFGIHDHENWLDQWRLRTVLEKTADEYLVLFKSLLSSAGLTLTKVERVVISSVVPAVTPAIARVTEQLTGQPPLIVTHTLETGLSQESPIPGELGADLLANAVAAWHRHKTGAIVVDFGTALTFTAVSNTGQLLGVSIAPGLRSAVRALSTNTAQLPNVDLVPPPSALPRTTVHSIQAGIVYGYVGLVKEVVTRMKMEMDGSPAVVATGGLADVIAPHCDAFTEVRTWHTLEGLLRLAELNP